MNKELLRKEILSLRKAISSAEISSHVCEMATTLPAFMNAETVMLYLATGSELDTTFLLAKCASLGKKVCLPCVINETDMEARLFENGNIKKGAFGIWEPVGSSIDKIDIIFVPGVVFDTSKNRIGYGKGYYDRFLAKHKNAYLVGLAYDCQVVDSVPTLETDIQMDTLITEKRRFDS